MALVSLGFAKVNPPMLGPNVKFASDGTVVKESPADSRTTVAEPVITAPVKEVDPTERFTAPLALSVVFSVVRPWDLISTLPLSDVLVIG